MLLLGFDEERIDWSFILYYGQQMHIYFVLWPTNARLFCTMTNKCTFILYYDQQMHIYFVLWPTNAHLFCIMTNKCTFILYYNQQMHTYFTNYYTPTCFDTIVSSSGILQSIPCQGTQVFQMQLLVIQFTVEMFQLLLKYLCNLARYWFQSPWGCHDNVETYSSVIICEIIAYLLVIVQITKDARYSVLK
jgi:hypothetical protein